MKKKILLLFLFILVGKIFAIEKPLINIQIKGVAGPLLDNIKNQLLDAENSIEPPLTDNKIQEFYVKVPDNVRAALKPYGYFKPTINTNLSWKNGQLLTIFIKPGPILKIREIDLQITGEGAKETIFQKLKQDFPLKKGQPLLIESYNKAKDLLFQTASNAGFIKAELTKKLIIIDIKNNAATIILYLNTNAHYFFGKTTFAPTPYADSFIKRFDQMKEHESFSSEKLLKYQQDLSETYYFKQVIVTPSMDKIKNFEVPIFVSAATPKARQYNLGLGYGTFTGARLSAGIDLRRVTSTGHHFNAQLKLSSVLKGLAAKYFIPGKNPLTDQYTFGVDSEQFQPKNGKSFSETLSAAYIKSINYWQDNFSVNYLLERYKTFTNPYKSSHLFYPSVIFSRIKADNMIFPTKASNISLTLQGSSQTIFSTTNFVQAELKGKYIFKPTNLSRAIIRGNIGYTIVKDLTKLPLTLNFFTGGMGSVRGYPYSSIGPGRYLKVAGIEFQHQIYHDWNGAIFYDTGTAGNHFNDSLMRSIGFGIVYNSVIGPIQVYLAKAIDAHDALHVEFSIGPDF